MGMKNSSHIPAYEDGTDRVFRNAGIKNSDARDLPRRNIQVIWNYICRLL